VRHSKLSASAVRWVPPIPLPAAGRTGSHLLSCPHCIAPRPERARIEALGSVLYLNNDPRASKPGGISPRSLQRMLPFWLSPAGALPGGLQGRFAPLRPIHTHGVSIQVPPLPSTARTSRRPRLGGSCH
jgi:hypothetical protein